MTLEMCEMVFVQLQWAQQILQVNFSKYHLGSHMFWMENWELMNTNTEKKKVNEEIC